MESSKPLSIEQDYSGRATPFEFPIQTLGGDLIRKSANVYEITDDLFEALSLIEYIASSLKNHFDVLFV